jgi:hypothetical protein
MAAVDVRISIQAIFQRFSFGVDSKDILQILVADDVLQIFCLVDKTFTFKVSALRGIFITDNCPSLICRVFKEQVTICHFAIDSPVCADGSLKFHASWLDKIYVVS